MEVTTYLNLISAAHRNKPRYRAWLSSCLQILCDIGNCAASMQKAFSVDDAAGVQLDIVGAYVGASRTLPFQPTEGSRILSDTNYRKLIRAKIAQNLWDGTNESLPYLLDTSFPELGIIIKDNQDMSINAVVRGTFTTRQLEMLTADMLLPRPAGVSVVYEIPPVTQETQLPLRGGVMITSTQQIEEA